MMNVPTITAMTAKTINRMRKNWKPSVTSPAVCSAASSPVMASTPSGSTSATRSASVAWSIEPSPAAKITCTWSSSPAMRWASSRVKSTDTEPAADSASPKVKLHTSV